MMTTQEQQLISGLIEKVKRIEKRVGVQEVTEVSSSGGSYTNEQAQDAVGNILTDSTTIDLTYSDVSNIISAAVIDGSITFAKMQNIATDSLIGRDTASSGSPENIG